MKSWSLRHFMKEFGVKEAARVMGYTNYRGLYPACDREIVIELKDGMYKAMEDRLINEVPEVALGE